MVEGDPFVLGQTVTYAYTLSNNQPITAVEVTSLSDSLGSTITCPSMIPFFVAAGESVTCNGTYIADMADVIVVVNPNVNAPGLNVQLNAVNSAPFRIDNQASVSYNVVANLTGRGDCTFTDNVSIFGYRKLFFKKNK